MRDIVKVAMVCVIVVGLVGCAHAHTVQGPVEKSEIPAGVQVSIGHKEVKEGDKLDVLSSSCRQVRSGRSMSTKCSDRKVGEAMVLKVLDHDSAIVEPQRGLVMNTSMKVEKQ